MSDVRCLNREKFFSRTEVLHSVTQKALWI